MWYKISWRFLCAPQRDLRRPLQKKTLTKIRINSSNLANGCVFESFLRNISLTEYVEASTELNLFSRSENTFRIVNNSYSLNGRMFLRSQLGFILFIYFIEVEDNNVCQLKIIFTLSKKRNENKVSSLNWLKGQREKHSQR